MVGIMCPPKKKIDIVLTDLPKIGGYMTSLPPHLQRACKVRYLKEKYNFCPNISFEI